MVALTASYRERLTADPRRALREGSSHFDKENAVFRSLERIMTRLDGLGVPYAVCGGMAISCGHTEIADYLRSKGALEDHEIRARDQHRDAGNDKTPAKPLRKKRKRTVDSE